PTITQTDLHQTRAEFWGWPSPLNFSSVLPPTLDPLDLVNDNRNNKPFEHLQIIFASPTSGHIETWGYTGISKETEQMIKELPIAEHAGSVNATLLVPKNHVVMVSFNYHGLTNDRLLYCITPYVTFLHERGDIVTGGLRNDCPTRVLSTAVYNHSLTVVYEYYLSRNAGFRMLFSFHPVSQSPHKVKSGLWNCSVPHYASFKQHVHCNLEVECEGGEDEGGHCPFSSPACGGGVAVNNKCYKLWNGPRNGYTWDEARKNCLLKGGDLPTMRTKEEWRAFLNIFQRAKKYSKSVDWSFCSRYTIFIVHLWKFMDVG
ncbi:hypothetical protein BaRGS_00037390, partial [Batillaria attramentaria]